MKQETQVVETEVVETEVVETQAVETEAASTPDALAAGAADSMLGPNPFVGLRPQDLVETAKQICAQAVQHPALLLGQEATLARQLLSIMAGCAPSQPVQGDKRFLDPAWQEKAPYRMLMQGYLAWRDALAGFVERSTLDPKSKERAQFLASLVTDAMSPTNSLLGNPAALRKAFESGGSSLWSGAMNLVSDTCANHGMPSQVDMGAFEVGKNLAVSKGAVVFRNELLELIQYAPSTGKVHARPQIIVPPQINKFYVFDLAPGKSLVELLVNSGLQVFVVSWRNPTAAQRDWGLDTYVAALLEAIDAACDITGSADVNLHGACSGAMTMSALLGYLASRGEKRVHAATLMVSVLGSSDDSQLGLFATPETVAAAKQASRAQGVLKGEEMGRVFAWMRPNDLVWNYWVNNYLMGNPPPVFDILFWNNDTTRLPATLHGQLIDMFADNLLVKPRALTVLGTPIDLAEVTCDKYVVAGVTDHITPWKGVFDSARRFGGKTRFVLSSSGHIQSLINPPGNPKAKYSSSTKLAETPEDWLASAEQTQGSWWSDWASWLARRSGAKRTAPAALGNERYPAGAPAPGTYVSQP